MRLNSTIRTAAATFAMVFAAGTLAIAQPKLEIVGGDTHDWGQVPPGKLTTEVKVKNAGNEDLKISEVRPGCGCTVAPIDKDLLKPGELATISVSLDVTSRSGPVEKTVTITSNDAATPSQILHLKADVHRAVTVSPMQYMMITNGKVGVESEASVTIKNTGDAPFTVEVPELSDAGNIGVRFDMKKSRELKPGDEFELKAYVTPKEAQTLHGGIKVKTSSSEMSVIDIPISGVMSQPTATQQSPASPQLSSTPESHK